MQIRKLVKSGYASLVIAIPKDWITKNKLKAGDLVYITDHSDSLTLSKETKEPQLEKTEIIINVDKKTKRELHREITGAYLRNFYYITIKGKELPKYIEEVKKTIRELVALELIEESSDKIMTKSFLNLNDVEPKVLIRRVDNILRAMIIDTKNVINNPDLINTIMSRDKEVNRLTLLVSKILKSALKDPETLKSLGFTEIEVLQYWEINGQIEKIGDQIKYISEAIPNLSPSIKKKFVVLFNEIETLYKDAILSFYNKNAKLSDKVSQNRLNLITTIQKQIKTNKSDVFSQMAINLFTMITRINDVGRVVRYMS